MEFVLLHNEEDYLNFKKLKPIKKTLNTKVKFICSLCNKESIKVFKCLNYPFVCKHCSNKLAQLDINVKNKKKTTCLNRFGVENCFESIDKMNAAKRTKLERYGNENYNNRKQAKQTCLIKYGYESPSKSPIIQEKMKESCFKKYGVDNYFKTLECRIKNYNAFISKDGYSLRSKKEQLLYEYISQNYEGDIILNNRTILNGKELDIYLPDLKLAFEFDGTYWHADPRFYNEDFVFTLKRNLTAKEIWKIDEEKNKLCQDVGIKIIHIKEYDWDNNNLETKHYILENIHKLINEEKNG